MFTTTKFLSGEIGMPQMKKETEHKPYSPQAARPHYVPTSAEEQPARHLAKPSSSLERRGVHSAPLSKEGWKNCLLLDHDHSFFSLSPSLLLTPGTLEQRFSYTLAWTSLSGISGLWVPHGKIVSPQESSGPQKSSAEVFRSAIPKLQERWTLNSCWRSSCPCLDPTLILQQTELNPKKPCIHHLL